MKTRELQTLWWDWLSTSERLLKLLHEQTVAVTLRDVARVERLQPDLDAHMGRIKEIDASAVAVAKRLAEELGCSPNLRGLVTALEKAEAQQLQSLANKVTVAAQNIQAVVQKNRTLMENEMTYINGTLTLIAKAAVQAPTPYRARRQTPVLVDQAA
jgi:hypothetical protein